MKDEECRRFALPGDGNRTTESPMFFRDELQLAARNRGMPLEALVYPVTPPGMHYLLTHFDVPSVDLAQWRLRVGGLVDRPLTLTLDEIKRRPAVTHTVTMECAGNGRALLAPRCVSQPWLVEAVGTAEWTGTPLHALLEETGVDRQAVDVVFTGLDRGVQGDEVQCYQRSLSLNEAMRAEVLLAYAMNGEPLSLPHGYPLRLIVPGWYGMTSVKWLDRIEAVGQPFAGYQMERAYRLSCSADDPGEPVRLMRVRALMAPPGIPDFLTRQRLLEAGPVTLVGKAWAGRRAIARVEASVDGGQHWAEAELGEPVSTHAWTPWRFSWRATPGRYTLCVRAGDVAGDVQPLEQFWTYQGMGNNMVQRVEVLVE